MSTQHLCGFPGIQTPALILVKTGTNLLGGYLQAPSLEVFPNPVSTEKLLDSVSSDGGEEQPGQTVCSSNCIPTKGTRRGLDVWGQLCYRRGGGEAMLCQLHEW